MEDLQPKLNSPKKKKKSKKLIPVTDIIDVRTKPHRGLSDNDVTYDESNLIEPKNDKKKYQSQRPKYQNNRQYNGNQNKRFIKIDEFPPLETEEK